MCMTVPISAPAQDWPSKLLFDVELVELELFGSVESIPNVADVEGTGITIPLERAEEIEQTGLVFGFAVVPFELTNVLLS